MPVFKDNSESIGRTPLVQINRLTEGLKARVLAKIEGRNPAYSVKCRIGAAMIWDAEKTRQAQAGHESRRTHQRQHGHRAGLRVCGPGLSSDVDHARHHVASNGG